jgi:hypothetical protein
VSPPPDKRDEPEGHTTMNLDELRNLREQIQNAPDQVTDEQLQAARDAIQTIRAEHADPSTATPETNAMLTELVEVRRAVVGAQEARVAAQAEVNAEAERLLREFDEPEQATGPDSAADGQGDGTADAGNDTLQETQVTQQATPEPALAASAVERLLERVLAQFAVRANQTPTSEARPEGRTGRPGSVAPAAFADGREVATATVYLGSHSEQGRPVTSDLEVARAIHEKWRGAYQAKGTTGRMPVLTVDTTYPESRILGPSLEGNFEKIRAVTSQDALVAAGGLCAPLETLYDVEVIGSRRPARSATPSPGSRSSAAASSTGRRAPRRPRP